MEIKDLLLDEIEARRRKLQKLQLALSQLPRGSLSSKTIQGISYWYLQWREGKKVVTRYIPADEVPSLKELLAKRKALLIEQKQLQSELVLLRKVGKDLPERPYYA